MKTRKEQMESDSLDGYNNFIGDDTDYRNWYAAPLGQSRDSEILEQVNFKVGLEMLGGESDTVRVERYGHWACGWIEQVYVKPGSDAFGIAEDIVEQLANYPVLNEAALSEAEFNDYIESWSNYYESDFIKGLVDKFNLSDEAEEALDSDKIRDLYESLVDDVYETRSDGCYCFINEAVENCTVDHLSDILGTYIAGLVKAVYSKALLIGSPDIFSETLRCYWDDNVDPDVQILETLT